jgi:type IV pilus assembly protein PilO
MALLPTKQRDQVMVLIIMVALGLAGSYWYFVFDPKSTELAKHSAHVDTLDMRNQQAKAELAKGTIEQVREEARASRANLDLMRTLVPAVNEVSGLIDQVSTAARRAHLDIGTLEPEPVIEGEMFDTYRYRLRMNGAYHDVAQMLTNIGSLNRIVTSINLQLNLPSGSVVSPPGKQELATTFEIQTYVVRTSPRVKGGAAPKKPGAPSVAAPPPPTPPPGATSAPAPTTKAFPKPPAGGE